MLKLSSQVNFKLENVFEPKRKYYNSTEIVLRIQVSKNDGIFDNRYRDTPEPKSHSNTCHSFLLKVLKAGSKMLEIQNYDNDFFERDRDALYDLSPERVENTPNEELIRLEKLLR